MSKALQDLTCDALELSRTQRLALVKFLLRLDAEEAVGDVDTVWDDEICARLKAYDEGRVEAIPYDSVLKHDASVCALTPVLQR